MIMQMTDISPIPVSENPFINWLLGFLFIALVGIIIWLTLQVNKALGSIKESIDKMSMTIVKLETEMGQLKDDNAFLRGGVTTNTQNIGSLTSDMARVLEWKKQTEKNG